MSSESWKSTVETIQRVAETVRDTGAIRIDHLRMTDCPHYTSAQLNAIIIMMIDANCAKRTSTPLGDMVEWTAPR